MPPKPQAREREVEEDRDDILATETPSNKSMLQEEEDADGPDNAEARREQRRPAAREEDDERLAYDDADDAPEVGQGRRARRNRTARLRQQQQDAHIAKLTGHVVALQGQLEGMSRGQLSLAAGDIDGQISQQQGHLETIDAALAKAVKDGDDAMFARANRLRDEARDRLQGLQYERRRLEHAASQRPQQEQQQRQEQARGGPAAPNPVAVRLSEKFMARHPWFDPEDASDEDSQIVKAIDDALANEGSNPGTKQHWIELERRVKARGLGGGDDVEDDNESRDENRREWRPTRHGGLPPRGRRGAGGRGASGGDFKLTTFMRETLDAEGLAEEQGLTEDQVKLRRKYIKTWRDGFDRVAQSGSGR